MSGGITFLDSDYLIALTAESDQWHAVALEWAARSKEQSRSFITTWPVLLEVGNALAKPRFRRAGAALLSALPDDPAIAVLPLTEDLMARGISFFANRLDKAWSLTDCISFVIMQDRGIPEALTHDEHFQQAGFRALLREAA